MGSKNVGQVAGMYVGNTPPENVKMIWWDSTPSQECHKIYDPNLKQWVILNQGVLSTITYNELKNLALSVGLSVGKFYVITDKGNVLSLSITRTKVQYVDLSGNLLVDDLGSNVIYYVSSNNLTIDGENGKFNEYDTKLNFNFEEVVPEINSIYVYGKEVNKQESSVTKLIKFKLSSLISSVTGNALSWKSGLYFNFNATLLQLGDKNGGVVLFDTYLKDKEIQKQINENIINNYGSLVSQVNKVVKDATSDSIILSKKITDLQTGGEPIDAAKGDSIYTVLSKFQRYINKFKYATGIRLSKNFSSISSDGKVNNNDTVETAIAKLQNRTDNIKLSLPEDWSPGKTNNESINPGELFDSAFSKIEADRKRLRDFEIPWTNIELETSNDSGSYNAKIQYRILGGNLEIRSSSWIKIEWVYTRAIVNDKNQFIRIKFPSDFIDKIMPYISIPSGDYSSFSSLLLSHLGQTSLSKVQKSGFEGEWVAPDISLSASVYFAYSQSYGVNYGNYFGIALVPVSMSKVSGGSFSSPYEMNGETTFQELLNGNTSCRFYMPPFVLSYKLF